VTLYTCPAGRTAILKDVRAWAYGAAVTRALVLVRSGPGDCAIIDEAMATNSTRERQGFIVLEPGHQLLASSTGGPTSIWASGAELDGVA
jgi:hypothetical protein